MQNEFLNVDCLEYMKTVEDDYFDLAIVDPPYGWGDNLNINTWNKKIYPNGKNKHKKTEWNNNSPDENYFNELMRISKHQIIWGGNYFKLPISRGWIFWDKITGNTFNFSAGELAWTSFDMILKKFTKSTRNAERQNIHPTQKPINLYKWILQNYANPGDKIFDSHVGSGSSLIACIDEGHDYIGCEIDKDYFDSASERIDVHKSQGVLF